MQGQIWILGTVCGIAWWGLSLLLGAKAYGVLGSYPLTGAVSGVVTGIAIALLSMPVYRLLSRRALLWYSPFSVYLAIAFYGLVVFTIRVVLDDFHPDQIRWAVGVQSILGMWWGVTFLAPVALVVHLAAYGNHRVLRRMLIAG